MSPSASTPANLFLTSIPSKNADFQEIWSYLRDGLQRIMNLMPGEEISFTAYTNLYTTVYNACMTSRPQQPVTNIASELYDNVGAYFAEHLEQIGQNSESLHEVDLLRYYTEQWERYTKNARFAYQLFIMVDRCWIKPQRDAGKMIVPVYILALIQWKHCFLTYIQQNDAKFTNALLRLINRDRDGEPIDQALVKTVVDSLVSLGLDNQDLNKECLQTYKDHFETLFIIETERYYKRESEAILAENSISEYLRKAEDRIREEGNRAGRYLHASTRDGLITICEHVLIREHAEVIRDNFQLLLDGAQYEDLRRVYAVLSRIPEGLGPLRKRFEAHVKQAGLLVLSKLVCKDETNSTSALLEIQQKNTEIVNKCFNGDAVFLACLDKAYQELSNHKVATGTLTRSSEPTTEYVDLSSRENNDTIDAEEDYVVI